MKRPVYINRLQYTIQYSLTERRLRDCDEAGMELRFFNRAQDFEPGEKYSYTHKVGSVCYLLSDAFIIVCMTRGPWWALAS
jgi:hypothetical protein